MKTQGTKSADKGAFAHRVGRLALFGAPAAQLRNNASTFSFAIRTSTDENFPRKTNATSTCNTI